MQAIKKRARALNDGADEVDWTREYGFEFLQHVARGGGGKSRKSRTSTNRGRGRGRGVRATVETPELPPFELWRQHQILQNAAFLQHHQL